MPFEIVIETGAMHFIELVRFQFIEFTIAYQGGMQLLENVGCYCKMNALHTIPWILLKSMECMKHIVSEGSR